MFRSLFKVLVWFKTRFKIWVSHPFPFVPVFFRTTLCLCTRVWRCACTFIWHVPFYLNWLITKEYIYFISLILIPFSNSAHIAKFSLSLSEGCKLCCSRQPDDQMICYWLEARLLGFVPQETRHLFSVNQMNELWLQLVHPRFKTYTITLQLRMFNYWP